MTYSVSKVYLEIEFIAKLNIVQQQKGIKKIQFIYFLKERNAQRDMSKSLDKQTILFNLCRKHKDRIKDNRTCSKF
jgi:hypothetical protein